MSKIDDGGKAFNVGLCAVVQGIYGWVLCEITGVKKATIKAIELDGWGRTRTINKMDCRFVGVETAARALFSRLVSSNALCDDERLKSIVRRDARNDKLIADALIAASKSGGSDE